VRSVVWIGARRPPTPIAECSPPPQRGCIAKHLWVSIGVPGTDQYDYQECVACPARRIMDLSAGAEVAGTPNIGWVSQGKAPHERGVALVACGACTTCPYRGRCHPARQHAAASYGEGRHYLCAVNREFDAQDRAAAAPRTLFLRALGALQRGAKRLPWPASLQIRVRR